MKKIIKYLKRNVKLGRITSAMMIIVIALLVVSCDLGCQECFDVTRVVYFPEFSTYIETVCYEIKCD